MRKVDRKPLRRAAWAGLLLACGWTGESGAPGATIDAPPAVAAMERRSLTAAALAAIPVAELRRNLPVRVAGVLTYFDGEWGFFFMQDETGGIHVRVPERELPLAAGQRVEVTGVTAMGNTTPYVDFATIRVLGPAPLPSPVPINISDLTRGTNRCQRVEVAGVIGAVESLGTRAMLHLHVEDEQINVLLRDVAPGNPALPSLVDARVRVVGVGGSIADRNRKIREFSVLVGGLDDIRVERPAPTAPFAQTLVRIAEVSGPCDGHRLRVRGNVIESYTRGRALIRDESGEMMIRLEDATPLWPDDTIEVVGFPIREHRKVILDHADVRLITASTKPRSAPAPTAMRVINKVPEVRLLRVEEAAKHYPVRLRGVVTFYEPENRLLFIRDAAAGLFVYPEETNLSVRAGQIVQVTGTTAPGNYVPSIDATRVTVEAEGELPLPKRIPASHLLTGSEDCEWIEMEGLVRRASLDGRIGWLVIESGGEECSVMVANVPPDSNVPALVGTMVRLRGACGTRTNSRRQIVGLKLFVPSPAQVQVMTSAEVDPFSLPRARVEDLSRFDSNYTTNRRVKVAGVVTVYRRSGFFIRDESGGLLVQSVEREPLRPGDMVEAVGFPGALNRTLRLTDAVVRKTGTAPLPEPKAVAPGEALAGQFDSERVEMTGRLVEISRWRDWPVLVLQAGSRVFEAHLMETNLPPAGQLARGCLLQLTGVCAAQSDEHGHSRSFRLLLNSIADVRVLERPPWWTWQHALVLAGSAGGLALAALAWVALLRGRVRQQTRQIRVQLEHEARLETRYRELFENANDLVFTAGLDGRITSFNRAAERITGYAREEAVGRPVTHFVPPGEATAFALLSGAGDGLSGLPASPRELTLLTKDGRRVPVEVNTQTIARNGEPAGLQAIARDISLRKQAEEAVRHLNATLERRVAERTADLEAANKELEAFSYSVSHDLRAPLRGIDGFSRALQEDCADRLGEEGKSYLQRVRAAAQRMSGLIDDMLSLCRISRVELIRETVDLSSLARAVEKELRADAPARHVEIGIAPGLSAHGDPRLLRIVLDNLLGNAWKFTQKNREARIEFGSEVRPDGRVFFVRDNGAGFDMQYAHKLFGAFQRLHGTSEFEGTGIGLATVQRIVFRHHGRIWAEGKLGEGATFYFTLPGPP
jgi:PAS domain S-box-containing protein